jgi:predicted alpha/beta superfamily hydrolase
MKKKWYFCAALILITVFSSCTGTGKKAKKLVNYMTESERNSVVFSPVSPKQKYYHEVADVAQYIQEMSVYDEELEATYIIHITLPPDYDENKSYPMYMMTDGIWRLSDHAELRPMMVDGEIEDIIMVSIGYDYGINAEAAGTRMIEFIQKSDLFLDFITNNLAPYLGELYHIDYNRSALMGHSFGGYFIHYAVFNADKYENQPFHYYVMASLSTPDVVARYYRGSDPVAIETDYFKRNKVLTKKIYVTAGEREYAILTNIENFKTRMKEQKVKTIEYEIWEGADHSSYVKPMMRKSLLKYYGIKKNMGLTNP